MKTFIFALLLIASNAFAEFQVPVVNNPVNDYANVLTVAGKEAIAGKILQLQAQTKTQVGVLIVPTLDGTSIEDASMQVANKWQLGSDGRDDGVLILISTTDRKFRIEVGQGLEGVITDYQAKKITESMKKYLRSGDYDGAVLEAMSRISLRVIGSNEAPTATVAATDDGPGLGYLLFVLFFCGGAIGLIILTAMSMSNKGTKVSSTSSSGRSYTTRRPERRFVDSEPPANSTSTSKKSKPSKSSTRRDDDSSSRSSRSSSSYASSSSDYSSSSSSDSSYSGGGGDFSGGGGSDSF